MTRAVVTGGAGFIGSNLVDGLLDEGVEVVVLDNLSTGREENLVDARARGARLQVVDITDADEVFAALDRVRPDVVFHLAAQIDVRRSVEDPAIDARINVGGTATLLEAARRAGVGRLVFSSTGGAIYGHADTVPTAEDAPIQPMAPYGQSKHSAEGYCHLYARLHGLSTICLRYGNVFGPRQDPLGEAGVVAIFCGRAVHGGGQPTVYGDGRQTRDYVYVADVVAANLAAAASDLGGSVNVGTQTETSVLDLIQTLGELVPDAALEPQHAAPRLGEIERSALDVTRARVELGWEANTALRDGLARTLAAMS
jgi:UDP-glucose 4-epimerase